MVLATACRALVSNLWGMVISQELITSTDGICRARDVFLTRDDTTDTREIMYKSWQYQIPRNRIIYHFNLLTSYTQYCFDYTSAP